MTLPPPTLHPAYMTPEQHDAWWEHLKQGVLTLMSNPYRHYPEFQVGVHEHDIFSFLKKKGVKIYKGHIDGLLQELVKEGKLYRVGNTAYPLKPFPIEEQQNQQLAQAEAEVARLRALCQYTFQNCEVNEKLGVYLTNAAVGVYRNQTLEI